MKDALTAGFLLFGALFMLLGAVGIIRMPDVFTRMQATTKATTLGTACTLLSVALHFAELGVATRALLIVCLVFLTAPIAAHMLGKAAYRIGVELWAGSKRFEEHGPAEAHTSTHAGGKPAIDL
jgi:multicomponent Na+:H+ antiporter subunit G